MGEGGQRPRFCLVVVNKLPGRGGLLTSSTSPFPRSACSWWTQVWVRVSCPWGVSVGQTDRWQALCLPGGIMRTTCLDGSTWAEGREGGQPVVCGSCILTDGF